MGEPDPNAEAIVVIPDHFGQDALRRAKVLIVDSQPGNVQILERILHRVRIDSSVSANDSLTALSLFQEYKPDLVLLDWMMADVNGGALIEQLRALVPAGVFTPILVLTENATTETKQMAVASGADDIIEKPFDAFEIVLRIANMAQMRLARLSLLEQEQLLKESISQSALELKKAQAELQTSQELVVKTQRLTAIGTMASGIAHDFNNALMLIMGSAEILLGDAERGRLTKDNALPLLKEILAAGEGGSTLVRQLRELSKSGDTTEAHEPLSLIAVIEQAVSFNKPKWEGNGGSQIQVELDLQEVPLVDGNAARLRDAITNLIFNAVDAMPHGGTLTLRTKVKGGLVLLQVSDTGTGMTDEVRRKCLEPFFTTKGKGGTGLGLAMVFDVVKRHLGSVEIASSLGQGTTFTLTLPALADQDQESGLRKPVVC